MAWIEKLHATYEACADRVESLGASLWPVSHFVKNAHIEVAIDASGEFRRVRVLNRDEAPTLIPATEDSAGRTFGDEPHPLCEELSYCAGDLPDGKSSRFGAYQSLLERWCASDVRHPKAEAVLACISKGNLWSILRENGVFPVVVVDPKGKKAKIEDAKVFVRWAVETIGDPCSFTWEDRGLIESWQRFDAEQSSQLGLCMVSGEEARLTLNHPRFIRFPGDGAKLISSNDFAGFTFRGRFTDEKRDFEKKTRKGSFKALQGCGVSFEVSQKAHTALRWLIKRQSYRTDEQVYVAWAVAGKPIPDPWADSRSLILGAEPFAQQEPDEAQVLIGDAGQAFARRLRRAIAGYRAKLDPTDDVVVIGLDSATPGRMAIIYYRELKGSEFLQRIEAWHAAYARPQNFGKDKHFTGAPAPHDIAEAAYATRIGTGGKLQVDEKLKKVTVERLLPCIVDGRPIPRDLVASVVRRASNRYGLTNWEWEKILGIACGLFRGWSKSLGEVYSMALEEDRTSRDYLYGRLLAVADSIERYALTAAEQNRDTMAGRLMQRFAERPFSTWRTIELALAPYKTRLRAAEKSAKFLWKREKLMDEIQCRFASVDFADDTALSGEFLLGYHCQRAALFAGSTSKNADQPDSEDDAS